MVSRLYSEVELNDIVRKKSLLHEWQDSGKSVFEFALEKRIHPSKIYRLQKRAFKGDDAFIDQRRSNKGRAPDVDNQVVAFLCSYRAKFPKAPLTSIYDRLKELGTQLKWRVPSYGQVCRLMRSIPEDMKEFLVEGSKNYFEEWSLKPIRLIKDINELWQMDASLLNLWVLDTQTGKLFQPWMIGIIDGASRVVLSARVFKETPDTANVLESLRGAIMPKNDPGAPWMGKPLAINSDNGSIFKSVDFLDTLKRLDIEHRPIHTDCPSEDGKIERWFKTFEGMFLKSLPGYAGQHRGLDLAKYGAIPWPLLQKQVTQFLLKYHTREHATLQTTPWEYYHENLAGAKGMAFTAVEVINACKIRKDAIVHAHGVQLPDKRWFTSPKLTGLNGKGVVLRLLPDGGDKEIEAYYKGALLDILKPSDDPSIAEALKKARAERLAELRALRKDLKIAAQNYLPDTGAEKSVNPIKPPVEPQVSSQPEINNIPELNNEEEV